MPHAGPTHTIPRSPDGKICVHGATLIRTCRGHRARTALVTAPDCGLVGPGLTRRAVGRSAAGVTSSAPTSTGACAPARQAQGVLAFVVFLVATLTGMKQTWPSSVADIVLLVVLMVLAHREFKKNKRHSNSGDHRRAAGSGHGDDRRHAYAHGIVITALVSGGIVGLIVALIVSAFTRVSDPRAVIQSNFFSATHAGTNTQFCATRDAPAAVPTREICRRAPLFSPPRAGPRRESAASMR